MKDLSVPKLELQAALLASRLKEDSPGTFNRCYPHLFVDR